MPCFLSSSSFLLGDAILLAPDCLSPWCLLGTAKSFRLSPGVLKLSIVQDRAAWPLGSDSTGLCKQILHD